MDSHHDFRSATKDSLRDKNSACKWKYGSLHSAGTRLDFHTLQVVGGNEAHRAKVRPRQPLRRSYPESSAKAHQGNIVKPRCNNNWWSPPSRVRDLAYAKAEVNDGLKQSASELLATDGAFAHQAANPDDFYYSFDRVETPGKPMTLDVFVKPSGRATERLVQKEYEILDLTGEALTGRKARSDLRKSPGAGLADMARDEDGFELV